MDTQRPSPAPPRARAAHPADRSGRRAPLLLFIALGLVCVASYLQNTSYAQDNQRRDSETELDEDDESDSDEGESESSDEESPHRVQFAAEPEVAPRVASGGSRLRRSASSRHASLTEGLDCATCHEATSWAMSPSRQAGSGFDHSLTGFPLTGQHDTLACVDCHRDRVVVRRECASCHMQDDYHQGRLGRECDRCHNARTWNDTRPFDIHRNTRLPLTGVHALLDCTECHVRTSEREYTTIPADCFSCHENDYRRPDVHPVHVGTASSDPFPRDCTLCHIASGFTPAFVNPIALPLTSSLVGALMAPPPDHEPRFPIRSGAHREIECATCHTDPDIPERIDCTNCHAHQRVTLIRQHRGAVPTDAMACLSCHPAGTPR